MNVIKTELGPSAQGYFPLVIMTVTRGQIYLRRRLRAITLPVFQHVLASVYVLHVPTYLLKILVSGNFYRVHYFNNSVSTYLIIWPIRLTRSVTDAYSVFYQNRYLWLLVSRLTQIIPVVLFRSYGLKVRYKATIIKLTLY